MKEFVLKYRNKIIFIAAGALAGMLYWRLVGCTSGTCPITSHWYSSGAYGMLFGWLLGDLFKTNKKTIVKDED